MVTRLRGNEESCINRTTDRRDFFRTVGGTSLVTAGAVALIGDKSVGQARAAEAATQAKSPQLPTIKIGDKTVTRMIVGGNPIQGYGHSVQKLSQHMMQYFTVERTAEFLLHCEKMGINTFQSSYSKKVEDALNKAREQGSKIQYIALTADDPTQTPLDKIVPLKPIGVSHHGVVTDNRFREGKEQAVHDYIKKVHDLGLLAGISTHDPRNIMAAEEKGWENDFFMACFYNVVRTDEEIKREFGMTPIGELYITDDPIKMTATVKQSKKVCLGFKILAAGRLSGDPYRLRQAFRFAFQGIKPTDGVIVGMYPAFHDEVAENVEIVRALTKAKA
ncbi:hypothetical protein FJY63_14485 [Candidatus Sumerlaeota bacterium]|nr:hypothetical protein [Candidatus Sumerlaeota bacterium]